MEVNKYCILRYNSSLRELLRMQLKSHNITHLCAELKIDTSDLYKYLNGKKPKAMTQFDLLKLCSKVGIQVTLNFKLV